MPKSLDFFSSDDLSPERFTRRKVLKPKINNISPNALPMALILATYGGVLFSPEGDGCGGDGDVGWSFGLGPTRLPFFLSLKTSKPSLYCDRHQA